MPKPDFVASNGYALYVNGGYYGIDSSADIALGKASGRLWGAQFFSVQEHIALREYFAAKSAPDVANCEHEFTDHCVICGVDAHEWFEHKY